MYLFLKTICRYDCRNQKEVTCLLLQDGINLKHLHLYYHKAPSGPRAFLGLFLSPIKKALIVVLDSVLTNQMPNLNNMYNSERKLKLVSF